MKDVERVKDMGQELVQSSGPGVNTNLLEEDLERLTDRWTTLNQKVNDWILKK